MSGMFCIAHELSIPKIGVNIMLSLTVKKLDAFKFDGVAESDNTGPAAVRHLLRNCFVYPDNKSGTPFLVLTAWHFFFLSSF